MSTTAAVYAASPAALTPPSDLPRYHGHISIAPSGRYFQDETGQGFLVIGQNDAVTWSGLVELFDGSSPATTDAYIADLRAHGVTVSRVMIEYAQDKQSLLETQPGTFAPHMVAFWDQFIALAEAHGLYLLLTPYDTFWQVKRWRHYPYSSVQGGPCAEMRDWLTAPDVIAAHKRRWEFIIRRWGGSPNIFAWDLMNEIELYWGCTPEEIDAYITEMAAFVRATEQAAWGKTHLVTTSIATPIPDGALGRIAYNHPALDFANTHLYVGLGVRDPLDTVDCAVEMGDGVRLSLQSTIRRKPYLDTESGPMDVWIDDPEFDTIYHHNMSWAHLASGGAGSGMRWPYTNPHQISPAMRDNLLGMARFAATLDWTHFHSRNISQHIRVSRPGVLKMGCADSQTALLWLLSDTRLSAPPDLNLLGVRLHHVLEDGRYCVEVWETYSGTRLAAFPTEVSEGKLVCVLPTFDAPHSDLALLIRRQAEA